MSYTETLAAHVCAVIAGMVFGFTFFLCLVGVIS